MALPDTQATQTVATLTGSAAVLSLPRVGSYGTKSSYRSNDGTVDFTISHTLRGAASQRLVRFDQRMLVADPLISGASRYVDQSAWVVMRAASPLITVAQQKTLVENLVALLGVNSFANTLRVLGGES